MTRRAQAELARAATATGMPQSSFIVHVRQAEPVVASYRAQFDPSARLGVPAHITVLYPFKRPDSVCDADLRTLATVFASVPRFAFALTQARQSPETIYLAPEPDAPFLALTRAIVRAFPEYPPYAGQPRAVVPHLTVARLDGPRASALCAEVSSSLAASGGITAFCSEVTLIENSSGRWEPMHTFRLGDAE